MFYGTSKTSVFTFIEFCHTCTFCTISCIPREQETIICQVIKTALAISSVISKSSTLLAWVTRTTSGTPFTKMVQLKSQITNYNHYNLWDDITYPLPNCNCWSLLIDMQLNRTLYRTKLEISIIIITVHYAIIIFYFPFLQMETTLLNNAYKELLQVVRYRK